MRHERPVVLPAPVSAEWDWQLGARCRTQDVDRFFDSDDELRAKAVCVTCPVIDRCRDYAVAAGEPHGIWGGLSPSERNRLRWLRPRTA
ncbi:WhiB family transcriptional regulator [Rhodococcoides kyotonense]|uniref:Transcriptional regulator WhiB n=1 Tax=Rhodococcoides kyotonense TaxID=398843 RepID=A0A239NF54_9NOCA|nr:WhiB family transcriptional regulator [Rhodococcus kyotonensis]SNT52759.1 WhiB family transcriptional regulator, redox-sensing transcriptional regulator [Rhodococcus kyotonensis]